MTVNENILGRFDGDNFYPSGFAKLSLVILAIVLAIGILFCFGGIQHKVDRDVQASVLAMNQEYEQLSKQEQKVLGFEGYYIGCI